MRAFMLSKIRNDALQQALFDSKRKKKRRNQWDLQITS